jgi:cell fate regulator YaaT (PSP1 superfamily)
MAETPSPLIIGVRFFPVGKLYYFDSSAYPGVKIGDQVLVETSRGRQLGEIMGFVSPDKADLKSIKPIMRQANPRDLLMKKQYEAQEEEALQICKEQAENEDSLAGVKFVKASYNYDGSLLSFLYTSEETVSTTRLRKRLAQRFRSRIEMRRIGTRDAAKLLGEYGACGSQRCCASYLTEFCPISIKMAKGQGISLNPSEITGMCGRLRCCLNYEYELYVEAKRGMPRTNKWVSTPHGVGKVIDLNPLKGAVTVVVEDTRYEFEKEEIQLVSEEQAAQMRAAARSTERQNAVESTAAVKEPKQLKEAPAPKDDKPRSGKKRSKRRGRRSRSKSSQDRQQG